MAAPSKYTPEAHDRIVRAIEIGMSRRGACALARVSPGTFANWVRVHPEFREAVEEAEGKDEEALVGIMRTHASKDANAAKWLLAVRHRHSWSDKQEPELHVTDDSGDAEEHSTEDLTKAATK